jgi:hypothetical protein
VPSLVLGPLLRHVGRLTATVWVETDAPCLVGVLDAQERTFEVSGHHYGLVIVRDLEPGTTTEYTVSLDGAQVWPAGGDAPPSRIRTLDPNRPQRIVFGSCRVATQQSVAGQPRYGVDALGAYSIRTASHPDDGWPDLLLMLGDQVYADDTTENTRSRIASVRSLKESPGPEVANFEEYTWLYHESWSDPEIRWLLSTVPVAMIFDDHDVHDDWNTSRSWRQDMQATDWWQERIIGGLTSYWVYQHLGNLSPDELDADPVWGKVRACAEAGEDCAPLLREFALTADREADGAKGYRWSFWRDLGSTRLVVLDSRCGRMLDDGNRSMLPNPEFDWAEDRLRDGDYDHVLIGTSLPWLLSPFLNALESWNERVCEDPSPRWAALGEKLRRGADLEHWPAFGLSFDRLARLLAEVGSGRYAGSAPSTICVLSGDVHHSYVCSVDLSGVAGPAAVTSHVYQVTCSPVHNWVPGVMRAALRVVWSRPASWAVRLLVRPGRLPRPAVRWRPVGGPFFGNAIATLVLEGRAARVVMESSRSGTPERPLETVIARDLSS